MAGMAMDRQETCRSAASAGRAAALLVLAALGPALARAAGESTVSGLLRDAATSRPLAGAAVLLGGTAADTTGADGRFRFAGIPTGNYRLIVLGACEAVPLRVEVPPSAAVEVEAEADTSCAHPDRLYAPGELPPAARFRSWPVAAADGVQPAGLHRPPLVVVAEAIAPDSSLRAVVAAPEGPGAELRQLVPAARPWSTAGGDWAALVVAGCFAPQAQLTLAADGTLLVRLLGSALDGPDAPVLRRQLCAGCVERFFADLERSAATVPNGSYELPGSFLGERTLAGVVSGRPILIRTSGLRLALVEAFGARLLDLCAYRGCIDPRDMELLPVELELAAPDSVAAGVEFEVKARAGAPELLPGAMLRLEVEGARRIGGEVSRAGMLVPGTPFAVAARYRPLPPASWGRKPHEIVVRARFAAEGGVPRDPAGAVQVRRIPVR
jgi:hypothetical protein